MPNECNEVTKVAKTPLGPLFVLRIFAGNSEIASEIPGAGTQHVLIYTLLSVSANTPEGEEIHLFYEVSCNVRQMGSFRRSEYSLNFI